MQICRTHDLSKEVDIPVKTLLIPNVIATGDHISHGEQFSGAAGGNAVAGSRIFTVDHNKLGVVLPPQFRHQSFDSLSAAFADDITEKDQLHLINRPL